MGQGQEKVPSVSSGIRDIHMILRSTMLELVVRKRKEAQGIKRDNGSEAT